MNSIEKFIDELTKQKNTTTVSNPYLEGGVAENLLNYLKYMMVIKGKRILLVGEAPGYKGCKITGIPFTSGRVFERVNHPVLQALKDKISLSKVEAENTATIVWNYLSYKGVSPLFWNSYPFHPYPEGQEDKNRPPNPEEIEEGVKYLEAIYNLFKPDVIAGIGHSGVKCAERALPNIEIAYIRHPSFGGKTDFIKGMDKII